MVARRHVFYLAGFDPIDAAAQHRRFCRESEKFARIWNANVRVSGLAGERNAVWQVESRGPNWAVESRVELLDWQDVVRTEIARPAYQQVGKGLVTFADFIVSGTAWRYFMLFWPYGLFFLTPYFHVFANLAISATLGAVAAHFVPGGILAGAAIFLIVGIACFALLFRWPGELFHVRRALADWNFARAFMYGKHHDMNMRLDDFASRLSAVSKAGECDEILIAGHSLGAMMSVLAVARAIERDPELLTRGPRLCLLTIGSTIGKLALHPAAGDLRRRAQQLADADGLVWTEIQARRDSISFFRLDPVSLKKFSGDNHGVRPLIRLIGIKDMMTRESYKRNWFRHMRLHYQFVMGNDKRSVYDYFMFVCGPANFARLSQTQGGANALFAQDGSYLAPAGGGTP